MKNIPFVLAFGVLLSSCAMSPPRLQRDIADLVAANQAVAAADKIQEQKSDYGRGNYLLYYLDRGMVEQMAGRFSDSIASFEKAKDRFNKQYTVSLSKEAGSWLANDYAAPYPGSDYEYVLVNLFQALNFVQMNDVHEALVEARDLDSKFQVIEDAAKKTDRRRFDDNGFVRMFMGILYEASGSAQDLNDALISYKQAVALYEGYYAGKYTPQILKENVLSLADYFNDADLSRYKAQFRGTRYFSIDERRRKAQVYVIELAGYSPIKVSETIPILLDHNIVTRMTLPRFERRMYQTHSSILTLQNGLVSKNIYSELGADIEDMAERELEARKGIIVSKAVLRPTLKYFLEKEAQNIIEKKNDQLTGQLFSVLGSIYNLYSEQADLRSWQTLPGQIRIAQLIVDPGSYHIKVEDKNASGISVAVHDVGAVSLSPGETKFIVVNSPR